MLGPRRRALSAVALLAVVTLVVGYVHFGGRRKESPAVGPGMEAHPFSVSIGQATSRARMVSVGGATYRLRPAGHDARGATVALTNDAGGVAFVNDTHGHVVATAPVWLIPGQTVSAIPATCRSTSHRTRPLGAPSARRTPISLVRCATE